MHPEIPWRQAAELRKVLIHDYLGVDLNVVWVVVEKELPPLEAGVLQPWRMTLRPEWGALAMSASTVIVAVNALLLKM